MTIQKKAIIALSVFCISLIFALMMQATRYAGQAKEPVVTLKLKDGLHTIPLGQAFDILAAQQTIIAQDLYKALTKPPSPLAPVNTD